MSSSVFFEYVRVLLLLMLAIKIDSRKMRSRVRPIRIPAEDEYGRLKAADCDCLPIKRCSTLRYRIDWKTAGETCEFGYGEYRGVCCPSKSPSSSKEDPGLPLTTNDAPKNEDCGLSTNEIPMGVKVRNATQGQWPWMAAIVKRDSNGKYIPWCSGFLIDKSHILTAAHCFENVKNEEFRARVGNIEQFKSDEIHVIGILTAPGYKMGLYYDDLAILTLEREVDFPNFHPVCLPDEQLSKMNLAGKKMTIAGWAAERMGRMILPHLRYKTGLTVITNQQCDKLLLEKLSGSFRRQFPRGISENIMCTIVMGHGQDACVSNSGGPLMLRHNNRWFAVGVVSFGVGCGTRGVPDEYVRISPYLNWIKQAT